MRTMLTLILLLFSFSAFAVQYSVTFENGTSEQKAAVKDVLYEAMEKISSSSFKEKVLNFTRPDGTKQFYQVPISNAEVYDHITSQKWEYFIKFYSQCYFTTVVAKVVRPPTIEINWCKYTNRAALGNTLVHEQLHVFDYKHDYEVTPLRPYSAPYALGDIMEEELGGKAKKKPYIPWYKKLWNWL